MMSLSQTSPHDWESILSTNLWTEVEKHALEKIYLPAAQTGNPTEFRTKVDILLKQWAERVLPVYSVQVGVISSQASTSYSIIINRLCLKYIFYGLAKSFFIIFVFKISLDKVFLLFFGHVFIIYIVTYCNDTVHHYHL